jgi:hypothetical protein
MAQTGTGTLQRSDAQPAGKIQGYFAERPEGEMAPRYMYGVVLGVIVFALVTITMSTLFGIKAVSAPAGEPVLTRDVELVVPPSGDVRLIDLSNGNIVAEYPVDERTDMRDVLRRFDLMRIAANKQVDAKYQLLKWADGTLAVSASDAKFRIYITGDRTRAHFASLLPAAQ